MITFINNITTCGLINSEGNPFGQGLNDCGTLKNRNKHMTMRLEVEDPNIKCNLGACLGMKRIKDGADKPRHDAFSKISVERVGFKYDEITHHHYF